MKLEQRLKVSGASISVFCVHGEITIAITVVPAFINWLWNQSQNVNLTHSGLWCFL